MRMYKVNTDGSMDIVVGSLMKKAGKPRSVYRVKTKIIRGADGSPEDIKISVACSNGGHYNWTAKERAKHNVEDQWSNVLRPEMERAQELFGLSGGTVTRNEITSDKSNRDKY